MKVKGQAAENATGDKLERIKKLGIVAIFSDDELLDQLVLKGGNAMDLVHRIGARASVDLDFSMKDDFDQAVAAQRVERGLRRAFEPEGYEPFDIKMTARPERMPEELADFWGGYLVEFKLIARDRAHQLQGDLEQMRREAIHLGEGPRFTIDISRHEYTKDKQEAELEGHRIYVYSPEMIVCEKVRAICQQMPEYGEIVRGKGKQRARDFVDIEALVKNFNVDLGAESAQNMVREMFTLKHVPLAYLPRINEMKAFHGAGYDEVKATIKAGVELQPWDYYFEFVLQQVEKLKPLWHM